MHENSLPLTPFYQGWDSYQRHLVNTIAPLLPDQLALRAAPHLWSVGMLAAHIVAARVGWFHDWMGEGSAALDPIGHWDDDDAPARSAAELEQGLEETWRMIQAALARWTPVDLEQRFISPYGTGRERTRQWIIWHVLEHDLHHGGELSLTLGMHNLTGIDL